MRRLLLALAAVACLPLAAVRAEGVHALDLPALEGGTLALAAFDGRPLLVVNTASRCGFTPQYGALQEVWERYRDQGLVVVGLPSNDFNQELASAAAIQEFCEVNFGLDFPMSAPVSTRGPDRHAFFARVEDDLGPAALPRWNFHKFLVARDGRVVASWPSTVVPTGPAITEAIEAALGEPAPAG